MRNTSLWDDGRGNLKVTSTRRCLLIGNTHWHWAEFVGQKWKFSHTSPDSKRLASLDNPLKAWAAVGPLPEESNLDPSLRVALKHIPLRKSPPWLGIDRALGAWGALRRAKQIDNAFAGLLLADAGTVLSLTKVNEEGAFAGGQLVPGLRLQLSAMSLGAKDLDDPGLGPSPQEAFPSRTADAMRKGAIQSLIGTLVVAQREAKLPLWLCGGDAPVLAEPLRDLDVDVNHFPHLALEGLVDVEGLINRDLDH